MPSRRSGGSGLFCPSADRNEVLAPDQVRLAEKAPGRSGIAHTDGYPHPMLGRSHRPQPGDRRWSTRAARVTVSVMDLSLIARDSVFPLDRALRAGLGPDELRRRLKRGECHRLHHGWFTTSDISDPETRHRLRTAALVEQYEGKAVASHVSALIRLDLPTFEPDLSVVHLMAVDPASRGHRKSDLIVHPRPGTQTGAAFEAGTERLPDTRRSTTHPALAIAMTGLVDTRAFLVPADAALRKDLVTRDTLTHAVALLGSRPGVQHARAALPLCDERHESAGESLTGFVLHMLGFRVVPQFAVPGSGAWTPGGQGFRADFGIVGTKVLVEFDGRLKYSSGAVLWDEKRREDRIRSLGYEVVRLTWADLKDPDRVRALIEAAIRRSARGN